MNILLADDLDEANGLLASLFGVSIAITRILSVIDTPGAYKNHKMHFFANKKIRAGRSRFIVAYTFS